MRNVMPIMISCISTLISSPVFAGYDSPSFYDEARVISVTPQLERVNEPRQECRTEYVRESVSNNDRSVTGSIIGGIAGGLLGSQVGRGNGRIAGAAVGAGVGAVVGDRIDNSNNGTSIVERPVQRCVSVDNWRTIERGYLVTYRYNGHDYNTVTNSRPGDSIRVRVDVAPVDSTPISYAEPIPAPVVYTPPHDRGWRGHPDRRGYYW